MFKMVSKEKNGQKSGVFLYQKTDIQTDTSAYMAFFSKKIKRNDLESCMKFKKVQKNQKKISILLPPPAPKTY